MILHQRKKEAGAGPRYRKRLCVSCFWLFCFLITSTTSTTANEVASLNLCVPVDGNLCRTRRFLSTSDEGAGAVEEHPLQQQPTAPNYFDNLRIALYNTSNTEAWNVSSEIKSDANSTIFLVSLFQEETNNSTATAIGIGIARQFRLVHISAFLPFSRDGAVLPINRNEGFTSLLALYHLNNMQDYGHPVLGDQILTLYPSLASCNVRFTMNLFDTQFSPSFTTQTMTAVSRRPVSIQSPPTSAVMGSHYSSETLPLATFTSAKDIPQVSASATSVTLDEKGQFPMFGRTVGSTDGEAAVAVQFFKEMGSTNVAVIFGTVSMLLLSPRVLLSLQRAISHSGILEFGSLLKLFRILTSAHCKKHLWCKRTMLV